MAEDHRIARIGMAKDGEVRLCRNRVYSRSRSKRQERIFPEGEGMDV